MFDSCLICVSVGVQVFASHQHARRVREERAGGDAELPERRRLREPGELAQAAHAHRRGGGEQHAELVVVRRPDGHRDRLGQQDHGQVGPVPLRRQPGPHALHCLRRRDAGSGGGRRSTERDSDRRRSAATTAASTHRNRPVPLLDRVLAHTLAHLLQEARVQIR